MLLIDFWGDNPFEELGLSFPPVPSGAEIGKKLNEKKRSLNNRMRKIKDEKDTASEREHERLKAEVKGLQELQRQLVQKANELKEALPFGTLLAVQPIAPTVFAQRSARATVIAQAWRAVWEGEGPLLSDTQRRDFQKDFTRHSLLDDGE
jgi:hypothetical protein